MSKKAENLHILLISVHGLIRGQELELGRDSDTGGLTNNALYIAKGDYMGMNGNYAAGIIEGVAHYIPDITSQRTAHEPTYS